MSSAPEFAPEPFRAGRQGPDRPRLSVIIPVLDEARRLPELLGDLVMLRREGCEVVVVDGGSTDETVALASASADRVLAGRPGRAVQMNLGASVASGRVLWFLHADTRVPPGTWDQVVEALVSGRRWGRCAVRLSGRRWEFRMIERLMNLRSCVTGIATGDQGIFVTREAFESGGGFAELPLMEDIALSRSLKAAWGRPVCLGAELTTSSRRWEERGIWRTVFLMWALRLRYWWGADPARLARRYR